MKRWFSRKNGVLNGPMLTAAFLAVARVAWADCQCNGEIPAKTPLNELWPGYYKDSYQGGLYPGGFNQRPWEHNNKGLMIAANQIYPRDTDGHYDADGKITMISIGMCNTTLEFGGRLTANIEDGFQYRVMEDGFGKRWKHPNLSVIDCADAGQDAARWAGALPPRGPWQALIDRGVGAQFPMQQVQVAWLKEAEIDPPDRFPQHAERLRDDLETILGILGDPDYFPNLKMVFLSSRTRAWTLRRPNYTHNPEPQAYESGFSVRWVIEEQLPPLIKNWPWLSWGPYLWADGDAPRQDRLTWPCSYVQQDDCVHPISDPAVRKVSDQLLAFFKTDPVARLWFLRRPDPGDAPTITEASRDQDPVYTTTPVHFHASATPSTQTGAPIREYVWTFDDGEYAYDPDHDRLKTDVTRKFPVPSQNGNPYRVHLTVIDNLGNAASRDIVFPVSTPPPGPQHSSVENAKHRTTTSPRPKQGAARKVATRSIKRAAGETVLGDYNH
jgi:hypothetical protein